jgi:DNA polymerase-1
LFGRRRYIPELNSQNFQLRSAAERMAINHPIQGTAADLIKMAMIEMQSKLKNFSAKMILQVHDELVFEVKKGQEKKVGEIVKEVMENVVKLRVPVKVEVNIGHSWGEMK